MNGRPGGAERTCRTCRHFDDHPLAIEAGLPALAALSSAHGASRSDDGLCTRHDRYLRATASCPDHAARPPPVLRPA